MLRFPDRELGGRARPTPDSCRRTDRSHHMATPNADRLAIPVPDLFRIRVRAIWSFLTGQPASFWLVNFYLMVEYVRPQHVWSAIDVLPWGLSALALTLGAVLLEGRLLKRPPTVADLWLLVFTMVLIISSLTAVFPGTAYEGWELYFSWVLVYVLITSTVTTEKRFFVVMLAFLLYSFKMSQHGFRTWAARGFSFSGWGATGGPGWFHNSGEFGIQMCIFLPLSIEFIMAVRPHVNRWTRWFLYLFPITALGSIVASSSRGALVGGAAVGLWFVARSKHRVRALLAIALVGAATWLAVPAEQKARVAASGEDQTSVNRIERWEAGIEIAQEHPLFGIGFNNWGRYYGPLSHNIFIEAWSELGYTGLLAFLGLIGATFAVNLRTRRLLRNVPTSTSFMKHMAYGLDGALVGYLVSGFFVTVLYYPYFWVNLALATALHTAALQGRRRAARGARLRGTTRRSRTSTLLMPGGVR